MYVISEFDKHLFFWGLIAICYIAAEWFYTYQENKTIEAWKKRHMDGIMKKLQTMKPPYGASNVQDKET